MQGPRIPQEHELSKVVDFLTQNLRPQMTWSIAAEYPTALHTNNLHNMRIITEQDRVISHAVLKPLIIKSPHVIVKVGAIGSVVTAEDQRGRGLSTQVLRECVQEAENQQCDIAILWTDLFDFYRRLGFELAGSEVSFLIEDEFNPPPGILRYSSDPNVAPEAIYRLYAAHTVNSVRTVEETKKFLSIPQTKVYTAWEPDGRLAAYAIEGKGADLKGYIHEWGGNTSRLLSLLSYIRREKKEPFTIIVPRHSQNLIQQLSLRTLTQNDGFLGMIKIINFEQLAAKIKRGFRAEGVHNIVLEKQGNQFVFGVGNEIFTLTDEKDVTRLIFGPIDIDALGIFKPETAEKFKKLLPIPLWIWGWDSI